MYAVSYDTRKIQKVNVFGRTILGNVIYIGLLGFILILNFGSATER